MAATAKTIVPLSHTPSGPRELLVRQRSDRRERPAALAVQGWPPRRAQRYHLRVLVPMVVQNAAMVNPRRLEVRAEEKTFVRMLLADDFWIACAKHLHCIKHNIAYHPLSLFHSTHTQVFKTKHKGWGVRTRQAIRRGDFVGEYVGELLGRAEADARDSLKVAAGFMYFLNLPGEIKEGAFPGESDEVEDTETANV
ncbi:hypothetical protein BC936DRAFT_139195 [Jimgerdemannia flammicorona]|uniref:SET domain-containing protein n=1 Tax=Jimgerdemannia flammicorona TaxID=994334 RepID=A0A433BAG1_9FUNG|nr:hypothetical protein BC936DRAFT_139195 [Jimgerdemannia flammicorona]